MQTSNQNHQQERYPEPKHIDLSQKIEPYSHGRTLSFLLFTLCLFAVLSLWIMQNSVNAYYVQTYHKNSPLTALDDYKWWKKGGEIGDGLYAHHAALLEKIAGYNQKIVASVNLHINNQLDTTDQQEADTLLDEQQIETVVHNPYVLNSGDEIFFAGDSMMQGVAPHVQQHLQKNYNIKSVNLSKQSTGLAYPKLFNWPKTIETTLQNNPRIKILAVFLGPNDPWDMPNLEAGGSLKFQTPEWEAGYRSRMASILNTAKQHNVAVIWITPPNMKKNKLNDQMIYLNQVMQDELALHDVLMIDSRELVGGVNNVYNDYLVKDGESIKMRSGDGIHFTVKGQKILADVLLSHLTINADNLQKTQD